MKKKHRKEGNAKHLCRNILSYLHLYTSPVDRYKTIFQVWKYAGEWTVYKRMSKCQLMRGLADCMCIAQEGAVFDVNNIT